MQLVDAARNARMGQFVYVSFSGSFEIDCPLRTAKRSVERHLQRSGLTYTILRPSVFMEVWLSPALGFDFTKGAAQIFGTAQQPISWISLGDVAEFAVTCVGHPAARNALIELGGPEALSPEDVVRTFEEVTGRHFDTQHVAETALQEQWRVAADPLQADDLGATNIVMQATVSTAAYGCCTILLPFRNFIAHQNATALVADPTTISPVVNPVRAFRSTTWIMLTLMPLVVTPLPVGVCSLSTT